MQLFQENLGLTGGVRSSPWREAGEHCRREPAPLAWGARGCAAVNAESWGTVPVLPSLCEGTEHRGYCRACISLCWIWMISWTKSTGQVLWKERCLLVSFPPLLCAPLSAGFIWFLTLCKQGRGFNSSSEKEDDKRDFMILALLSELLPK